MTKFQSACKHIELREAFYEVKFNVFQRAYAHAFMFFHKQALIEGANEGLQSYIDRGYTAAQLRKELA